VNIRPEQGKDNMRIIDKDRCAPLLAASLAGLISLAAAAQGAAIQFRVVAVDRNPSSCQRFDAALSRVHTFTPAGDTATLMTAGGTNFNVVADTSKSPKTLDVTEPRLGCRWNAVAP
jgi:hypothetical protein